MDVESAYKFATEAFADYFAAIGQTLLGRPFFMPARAPQAQTAGLSSDSKSRERLQPALFGFIVISVFFGISLEALRNKDLKIEMMPYILAFLLISWMVYSLFAYGVCKLLRGRGSFLDTISMMLQLLSTLFVVCTFISLGVLAFVTAIAKQVYIKPVLLDNLTQPNFYLYYLIHVLLLLVYVPLVMRRIHGFGVGRTIVLFLIPPIAAVAGITIIFFKLLPVGC